MQKPNSSAAGRGSSPPFACHQGGYRQGNSRPMNSPNRQQWERQLSTNYRHDRPPGQPPPRRQRPNFVIWLRTNSRNVKRSDVDQLVAKLKFKPQDVSLNSRGDVVGSLSYEQWSEALETMVQIWEIRLNGHHRMIPLVEPNVQVASDKSELQDRLKTLFLQKVMSLMEGELIGKWQKKLETTLDKISRVSKLLNLRNRLSICADLLREKEGLVAEKSLIEKRIEEFRNGLRQIVDHLDGQGEKLFDGTVNIFSFGRDFNWERIHQLMSRECRRLDEGLPIYAFRQEILRKILCQQVMVLVGETGSGKSTQLVQFLADSGVAGDRSIVCTQPRKLAAMSLAERVKEECLGCYEDTSIFCQRSYSSSQLFDSKGVVFLTDHCLLQHYMNDKNLSGISCVVVDEAHERSLNTDLLLAMIKNLVYKRPDLRLIIMSATADADLLAEYYFGCEIFHVSGRTYPVDIKYVPSASEGITASATVAPYVCDVLWMVTEIHKTEREGTILAFLTSQMEVEWACERFQAQYAVVIPLHGKLSYEDQQQVFLTFPGKRKVIFATNIAETSLTIPGVKYVVDCGMVKECRFEPQTGMNVLRVCTISKSSAVQRAGRAGRTEPGRCYRLYSEPDFENMPSHQEPEIRRVHLGIAVLRILALGIKDVHDFDFVDAPSPGAVDMACKNLVQLGAVTLSGNNFELTSEGWALVKLGIEPRLGRLILKCFDCRLGKEGLVLAAVMANASSIFCRVGTEDNKIRSDCLKVQFCHPNGDLFTLLAVYKHWENMPPAKRNVWCWDNSINAKSMRRCQDTVQELESCLQSELNKIIPSYWRWDPQCQTEHDEILKEAILSSLVENVAMYSGYDQLGYELAQTRNHIQLHPSCSLLNFGHRPTWVVFGEILASSREYLTCVTVFEFKSLAALSPQPLFDFDEMDRQKLQRKVLTGFGSMLLKRFCGKSNSSLQNILSRIRRECMDDRIGIDVSFELNEVLLYASSQDMEKVYDHVQGALQFEHELLQNECLEKCLYSGSPNCSASVALFGAGGEIRHLELGKRCLTIDVFHSNLNAIDDKELLMFLQRRTCGGICVVHRFAGTSHDGDEKEKWGRITFLSPDAARRATELCQVEFNGGLLKLVPSRFGSDQKMFSSPALRAKIYWPRRPSRGTAIVKCNPVDVAALIDDFSSVIIRDKYVRCGPSMKYMDSVVISGLDKDVSEAEIFDALSIATKRKIVDIFLVRGDPIENPSVGACEEALLKQIVPFMPRKSSHGNNVLVKVFPPEPKDTYMKAAITFDGGLHLEAAKALEQLDGTVVPGCFSWQKIKCQHVFHSSVSCPPSVYHVIRNQLEPLVSICRQRKGVECILERNENGSCRVKLSAGATRVVAELRRPLEQLMKGRLVDHAAITPKVLPILFSRDGIMLMKSIQRETGTYVLFNRHDLSVRLFGSPDKIDVAQERFISALLKLHESKQLEVHLRDRSLPHDMMKRVVQKFGPHLSGLKERIPGGQFSLNTKRQIIGVCGTKEMKQQVEDIIYEIGAEASDLQTTRTGDEVSCPICLCDVEDGYRLDGCLHEFCRSCLVEQCESAIRSQNGFPLSCTHSGCGSPILLTDLKSLLPAAEKLDELFRASLGAFVARSAGTYRFCPSPDCPSVYKVADPGSGGAPFVCGACYAETCTRCHVEYHPYLSCEKYREFKRDPDSSLQEWCKGKENVKKCPVCHFTIEKVDGCNHIECKCGKHVCWVCLEFFGSSDDCYDHLRSIHFAII